jgi:iron-sulfur cluster assembly accessory protein
MTDHDAASVTISERAARRILDIVAGEPDGTALRISVSGGGCSGFQYGFDLDRARAEDDIVVERDGAVVLIDPVSLPYMGRLGDRFRRRPDRTVVPGTQSERHRVVRMRDEFSI